VLNSQTIQKLEDFVYAKPRSVQEIAEHLGKNWRTADRYVDEIEKDFGTVSTRVFRGGTRGALKIVYWSSTEKASHSIFQEKLEKELYAAKKKEDSQLSTYSNMLLTRTRILKSWTMKRMGLRISAKRFSTRRSSSCSSQETSLSSMSRTRRRICPTIRGFSEKEDIDQSVVPYRHSRQREY